VLLRGALGAEHRRRRETGSEELQQPLQATQLQATQQRQQRTLNTAGRCPPSLLFAASSQRPISSQLA
jgi:hypothetical protein